MQSGFSINFKKTLLATALVGGLNANLSADVILGNDLNSSVGSNETINSLYAANRGSNGGDDQSLQFGDVLYGTSNDNVIIGGLGIDILWGKGGDDILIGGTEDFNPLNRDRAFGGEGDDVFIWAPGDGNDFFDGENGVDVLVLGLIGESKDANGDTAGAPFFSVSAPGNLGTGDFDGIYLDENENPVVDIKNGPGFCEIVEQDSSNIADLDELNIDHLVRFVLRDKRTAFLESLESDTPLADDGLRIAVHIKNVEFLVCGGNEAGTAKVFDLSEIPAVEVDVSQLPLNAQNLVGDSFIAP